jgi:pyridoxal phosphate enzyme (YggS family)
MTSALAGRLHEVRERIASAARAAGRDPSAITLIAVTKFHPVELIRELASLGVHDIGENRHQEAQEKARALADAGLRWHFVGRLQTNKARRVVAYADVLHSIDRQHLVHALSRDPDDEDDGRRIDCFLQVSLDEAPGRGGAPLDRVEALAEEISSVERLHLIGVMAVAPLGEDPGRAFERLRHVSERVRRVAPGASNISAGMSHDFEAAIAHGATHLRIGTAITGERPLHR